MQAFLKAGFTTLRRLLSAPTKKRKKNNENDGNNKNKATNKKDQLTQINYGPYAGLPLPAGLGLQWAGEYAEGNGSLK